MKGQVMGAKRLGVLVIALVTASCTTGVYEPSVGQLSSAARVIGPLVSSESLEFRKEYRRSLLQLPQNGSALDLKKFVCEPLGYTSAPLGSGSELSGFGNAARDVATVPRQRGWIDLIGSLFQSYELPPVRPVDTERDVRADTFAQCDADVNGFGTVNEYLVSKVGSTVLAAGRGGADDAIAGIIEIVEPAVLSTLATIDDHRRARALREFFSDETRVASLKAHVKVLKDFFSVMDKYRRLRAMEAIGKAAASKQEGARDAEGQLVSLAASYDTVFAVQMERAFQDIEESIDALVGIANGNDEVALIHSATAATFRTIRAIQGISELTEDGPKKERLQRLIDQLNGETKEKDRDR